MSVSKNITKKNERYVVKLITALNKNVLFPILLEKQNVNLDAKLFDEKNIAAVKQLQKDSHHEYYHGNIYFLEYYNFKWYFIIER